jgi:hypothetical protein
MADNKPVQLVEGHVDVPFNVIDISALDKDEKERKRAQIYAETTTTPFDFAKAPLFRSVLLKEDEEKFHSLFTLHHIITDGWSMGILKKEFSFLYESLRNREPVELGPVKLQYKDFSTWYNKQIGAPGVKEKSRRFWEKKLEKGIPVLYLPGDFGKSRDNKDGGRYRCLVSEDIKNGLKKLARNNNTTLSMAMFSAFIILLSELAGQQDITCALISAGRNHISLSDIVGYFTNSVLIISRLAPAETIADFLERLDADVLETIEHQNYPVELVLDDLKINYPDIPAAFNMLNLQEETGEEEIETFPPGHIRGPIPDVKFDIELYVTEYKNGIEVFWNYNKSLFKPSTIELISRGYLKLLNYITNQ